MNAFLTGEEDAHHFTSIQQPLLTPSASFLSTSSPLPPPLNDHNHNHNDSVLMVTPTTLETDTPVLVDDSVNEEEENERAERCWKDGHREQSYICLANNHIVRDDNSQ